MGALLLDDLVDRTVAVADGLASGS